MKVSECGLSTASRDPRETSILWQRISVLIIQRFNVNQLLDGGAENAGLEINRPMRRGGKKVGYGYLDFDCMLPATSFTIKPTWQSWLS